MLFNILILLLAVASTALASSGQGARYPAIKDKHKAEIGRFSKGKPFVEPLAKVKVRVATDNGPAQNAGNGLAQAPTKYPTDVALKCSRIVFTPGMSSNDNIREEFQLHRAASKISSDVLPVFNFIEKPSGKDCFTMTLARNGDLMQLMYNAGALEINPNPMPKPLIEVVIFRIARALAALHKKGIVHRDVKEDNVIMTDEGSFKLFDFDCAIHNEQSSQKRLHGHFGTETLIAPEYLTFQGEFRDKYPTDQRPADIYALGEMLSSLMPFSYGEYTDMRNLAWHMHADQSERFTAEQVMHDVGLKTAAKFITNDDSLAMVELKQVAEEEGGPAEWAKVVEWLHRAKFVQHSGQPAN